MLSLFVRSAHEVSDPKHLPGAGILVKNIPGAGHIIGANTLYASRPHGLTIGTINTGLIYDQLLMR